MPEEEKEKVEVEAGAEAASSAQEAETSAEADAAFHAEVEELKAKLAVAEEKAADYLAQLTRLKADFINYRRRMEREHAELTEYANARLLKELLPVLDNLERALAAGEDAPAEALRQGVAQVVKQFLTVLEKEGVTPLDPGLGQPFDPEHQEALLREEGGAEVVVAELQRGYRYKEKVLRPTLVKVGPAPKVQDENKEPAGNEATAEKGAASGNEEVEKDV